jgi:hypothetical protein
MSGAAIKAAIMPPIDYRPDRAEVLKWRCIAAKAVKPQKRYIVGIGWMHWGYDVRRRTFS